VPSGVGHDEVVKDAVAEASFEAGVVQAAGGGVAAVPEDSGCAGGGCKEREQGEEFQEFHFCYSFI
jgi:hypothetical protein